MCYQKLNYRIPDFPSGAAAPLVSDTLFDSFHMGLKSKVDNLRGEWIHKYTILKVLSFQDNPKRQAFEKSALPPEQQPSGGRTYEHGSEFFHSVGEILFWFSVNWKN
jgi:hypothetical protein